MHPHEPAQPVTAGTRGRINDADRSARVVHRGRKVTWCRTGVDRCKLTHRDGSQGHPSRLVKKGPHGDQRVPTGTPRTKTF